VTSSWFLIPQMDIYFPDKTRVEDLLILDYKSRKLIICNGWYTCLVPLSSDISRVPWNHIMIFSHATQYNESSTRGHEAWSNKTVFKIRGFTEACVSSFCDPTQHDYHLLDEDYRLLGCYAMWFCRWVLWIRRNLLLPSSGYPYFDRLQIPRIS